jgi:TRAP-type C4-dicarboxylate transport system permease small subunit
VFAAEMTFIVVVYVCKIAVTLLLHRLASQRFKRAYAIATVAACVACCIASMLAIAIQDTGTPWLSGQKNARSLVSGLSHRTWIVFLLTKPLQINRWIAYAVMSNLLDICLSLIPALIIHDLQIPTSKKCRILFSFAIRLT